MTNQKDHSVVQWRVKQFIGNSIIAMNMICLEREGTNNTDWLKYIVYMPLHIQHTKLQRFLSKNCYDNRWPYKNLLKKSLQLWQKAVLCLKITAFFAALCVVCKSLNWGAKALLPKGGALILPAKPLILLATQFPTTIEWISGAVNKKAASAGCLRHHAPGDSTAEAKQTKADMTIDNIHVLTRVL